MTSFINNPPLLRAIVIAMYLATLIFIFFLGTLYALRKSFGKKFMILIVLIIVNVFEIIILMDAHAYGEFCQGVSVCVSNYPIGTHIIVLICMIILIAIFLRNENRYYETKISPNSIYEALDNLPIAFCFSNNKGVPLLTNHRMYRLSKEISGHFYRNAEEFWQELTTFESTKSINKIRSGVEPVLILSDGEVWKFSVETLDIDGNEYFQTIGTDITKLYLLSSNLRESNTSLLLQQERLKKLGNDMMAIQKEEETLTAKIVIHNELGRCILATSHYLNNQTKDLEEIVNHWHDALNRLELSAENISQSVDEVLIQIIELSELLGCHIEIIGELPDNDNLAYLILTALKEATINAIRHANASQLTVTISDEPDTIEVRITNNSNEHVESITEGGGLSSIRHQIERERGEFQIHLNNGVELFIKLPKRKE